MRGIDPPGAVNAYGAGWPAMRQAMA